MKIPIKEVKAVDHVGCWTDRFITEADSIRLISLFGSSTRVKAIKAVIQKGDPVYLQNCWTGDKRFKVQRPSRQLQAITRQLARGVAHCLLYAPDYLTPEGTYPQKIFFGDSLEQIFQKFFYAAQTRYSTPLLPAWTEWLWGQMEPDQEINTLGFSQVKGVRFLEEEELEARLFEAGSPLHDSEVRLN